MYQLARILRAELDRRGWSNRRLARAAGISSPTLTELINNPNVIPRLDTLAALATALQLPLGQLIEASGYALELGERDISDQERIQAIEYILALHPDDLKEALAGLAEISQRRRQTGE